MFGDAEDGSAAVARWLELLCAAGDGGTATASTIECWNRGWSAEGSCGGWRSMRACWAEVYLEGIGLYDAGLNVFSSEVRSFAGGAEDAGEEGGSKPL